VPIDLPVKLTELKQAILVMGANVEHRVKQATMAILNRDEAAAATVRAGDDEIDRMELDIEEECLRILALSHPVAGDLRFVLAVMRINSELERIADLARSIAKRAQDLQRMETLSFPPGLKLMAEETRGMLSGVLTALSDQDADFARRIRLADDRVDDLLKEIFAWIQEEIPRHVEHTEQAIDVLSVARKLERIADLATNMAEEVIFLIEGEIVRHSPG